MRIAIVDDEASERKMLRERVQMQLARYFLYAEFMEFADGTAFLTAARSKRFDLVFLDVYLIGKTGMEAAKELRTFDPDCTLVFITNSKEHALDAYRVRAAQYLVKPYTDQELTLLFDEMMKRLPAPDRYIEVGAAGGTKRLRFHEIMFAEHYQHQIHIYTADGKKTVTRQTFHDFAAQLSDERFFLCNRGTILNLEYAADFDGVDFILKNGKRLSVSRNLSKTAKLTFGDFLFRRRRRS